MSSPYIYPTLRTNIWFASYTLVIYDYICTFPAEVQYVWSCPWSIGLILFYLNRYLPVIDIILFLWAFLTINTVQEKCLWYYPLTLWVLTLGILIPQIIIVLRTYALWGRRPSILWTLIPLLIFSFIALSFSLSWKTYLDVTQLQRLLNSGKQLPALNGCQTSTLSSNYDARISILCYNLSIFLLEVVISILTAKKAREHLAQTSDLWVNQLYKNGILYCFCMVAATTINMALILFAKPKHRALFLTSQRCLTSILANRIIFLILKSRKVRAPEFNGQPSTNVRDIFTSIYPDGGTGESDYGTSTAATWQVREQREWIR